MMNKVEETMDKLHSIIATENTEKGGYDIVFPEYPGLTAYAKPNEDISKVGYEAFRNAPKRIQKESVCPICEQKYSGYPALSRKDGKTQICSDCGIREALEAIGYDTNKIEESIAKVHRLQEKNTECVD